MIWAGFACLTVGAWITCAENDSTWGRAWIRLGVGLLALNYLLETL